MTLEKWTEVDEYLENSYLPEASEFDWLLEANRAADLPPIDVSPAQAKLLKLLVRSSGASRVLEIGTLGGYSTVWMAQGLPANNPAAKVVTLEIDAAHAKVAKENFQAAKLTDRIELQMGSADALMKKLISQSVPPFDFVFVDADKESLSLYLELVLQLTRPGSLIVFDNVVRQGEVTDQQSTDSRVLGVRAFHGILQSDSRLDATAIQTVGRKGYDGFAFAIVNEADAVSLSRKS